MSGPSDKAVVAAAQVVGQRERLAPDGLRAIGTAEGALEAAHDPALGLDRSVCLRDVVEKVRRKEAFEPDLDLIWAADFIERGFGLDRA